MPDRNPNEDDIVGLRLPHLPKRPLPDDMPRVFKVLIHRFDALQEAKLNFILFKLGSQISPNKKAKFSPTGAVVLDVGTGAEHNMGEEHGHEVSEVDHHVAEAEKKLKEGDIKGAVEAEKKAIDAASK